MYEVYNREVRKLGIERDPDGCNLVGKVAQWRPGGHGFNPYIPHWHLVNEEICMKYVIKR